MAQVTKQDILNDLQLLKKGLQEVEFYIRNYTNEENINKEAKGVLDYIGKKLKDMEENISKGVNGVIDYISKILKDIANGKAINYAEIVNDAKKKGLEKEFKIAYSTLRKLNFIDYDQQNKLIIIGNRTKYLIKSFTDSKFKKKQSKTTEEINQKKVTEIYNWILDQIIKNEWVEINTIKSVFKGYEKEIMEAVDKMITESKGKLVDNKIYRVEEEKPKTTEISKAKRIKELKEQIDTLERKIEISQAMELSKEELQKLIEEKKKLEEELKQLENQQ